MAKQKTARMIAAILTLLMVLGISTSSAFAATSKTVKPLGFTSDVTTVLKKDTVVKRGTTSLTWTKGEGWITFVAPATKTYSFTFSNFRGGNKNNAFVSVYMPSPYSKSYLTSKTVTTYGGKTETLWLSVNGAKYTDKDKVFRPIAKRTAKVKLKKGQRIFFYCYCGATKRTKATLAIRVVS